MRAPTEILSTPVAANLANGIPPSDLGPEIQRIVTPSFANIIKKKKLLIGEVIYIDSFGNIVTNIEEKPANAWR